MEQQIFDIRTRMAVYGANEQLIGTVAEIAGFGSTRIDPAPGSTDAQVAEARSGTGYLKVECSDKAALYVQFHGIDKTIPGRGVNLTSTMLEELWGGTGTPPRQADVMAQPQRRRWSLGRRRRWRVGRPRTWKLQRSEATAAPASVNGGRRET